MGDVSELTGAFKEAGVSSNTPVRIDWIEAGSPSIGILETVARVAAQDVMDLPPVLEYFDPESLDDLLMSGRPGAGEIRVSVSYAGLKISAWNDGIVEIGPEE